MWYATLFRELENNYNEEQSKEMAAYMQNKFMFLGIQKPHLKDIERPYFKEAGKYDLDWSFVEQCWQKEYREAQYVAVDYLNLNIKKLMVQDFFRLKELILQKSWWETVDSIDKMIGYIVEKNPELENDMLSWSQSENIWLKRVAIDFQQEYKKKTNTQLLELILRNNLDSRKFFINKAIGWSLRDYSKTNPEWVRNFLKKYEDQLSSLSKREAGKYIKTGSAEKVR
jgi:3-methyladenine DNA glycosylase AlkD